MFRWEYVNKKSYLLLNSNSLKNRGVFYSRIILQKMNEIVFDCFRINQKLNWLRIWIVFLCISIVFPASDKLKLVGSSNIQLCFPSSSQFLRLAVDSFNFSVMSKPLWIFLIPKRYFRSLLQVWLFFFSLSEGFRSVERGFQVSRKLTELRICNKPNFVAICKILKYYSRDRLSHLLPPTSVTKHQ